MGFGITDIIAFAKAGWTPADVKSVIALANENEQADTVPEIKDSAEDIQADQDADEKPAAAAEPESKADAVDYKKLYEEQKALTEKIQQKNIRQNLAGSEKTLDEQLQEIARGFM